MIYDGKVHLNIQPRNLTTDIPTKIVQVKEGSCVLFAIIGTPRLLPPSSLAVTAYASSSIMERQ
jgi:hypothetical protein